MWHSDTSSDRPGDGWRGWAGWTGDGFGWPGWGSRPWGAAAAAVLVGLAALAVSAAPATARVFLTQEEAIELAFPDCRVERQTVYLTDDQRSRASELAGQPVATRIVYPYRARCARGEGGSVYFDTHRVRTLPETLMVVVDPRGAVRRVEILSFKEPPDYIPREPWYRQFDERRLDRDLALKRGIHSVTGATLTARATTEAVRRVLALHRVLEETTESGGGKRAAAEPRNDER